MKILFIGDSLVRGTVGVNWVQRLADKHPEWQIENAGANGETLNRIIERLKEILEKDSSFDYIVLEGGANDLLLPYLGRRGLFFRHACQYLFKKGHQPITHSADLEQTLNSAILLIRSYTRASVILTTIPCLNEDRQFELNRKRQEFNEVIRRVAQKAGCALADTGALFDGYLQQFDTKNYFLESFLNTAYLDKWQCCIPGRADSLSRQRGLQLTLDGLHLNSTGAGIFLHEMEKQIAGEN